MRKFLFKPVRGVTLTELLITIFLVGILAYIMPVAVKLLNAIKYQQQMAQTNLQIETFVSLVELDINNALDIIGPLPQDGLSLKTLNSNKVLPNTVFCPGANVDKLNLDYYDAPPKSDLFAFNTLFSSTVTYKLVNLGNNIYTVRRTVLTPLISLFKFTCNPVTYGTNTMQSRDFLTGLVQPNTVGHPLFCVPGNKDNSTLLLDLAFLYPFQKKTNPPPEPRRFLKTMLKWSNYLD